MKTSVGLPGANAGGDRVTRRDRVPWDSLGTLTLGRFEPMLCLSPFVCWSFCSTLGGVGIGYRRLRWILRRTPWAENSFIASAMYVLASVYKSLGCRNRKQSCVYLVWGVSVRMCSW